MEAKRSLFQLDNIRDARQLSHEIQRRWLEAEKNPAIFRYQLNIKKERIIEGQYDFILQLNVDRGTKRRAPCCMDCLEPPVDEDQFNFTKIQPLEKLLDVKFKDYVVSIIINNSPVTKYHSLLVTRMEEKLPQVLTYESIHFALRLLRVFNSYDFHIGFNSPGASASVNHQHLHLIYVPKEMFAQRAEIRKLRTGVYCLDPKYEMKAICFLLNCSSTDDQEVDCAERLFKLVRFMVDHKIAHNLFMTLAKHKNEKVIRSFVYPRDKLFDTEDPMQLNFAFCEFGGFVPIACESIYDTVAEKDIIGIIKGHQDASFKKIVTKVRDHSFFPHVWVRTHSNDDENGSEESSNKHRV